MINNLPQYWTTTAIGELCTLFNGRAFKQSEWRSAGLPIIRIQNLNKPNSTFNYFDGELDDRHKVKEGDLLFAWSGTPGTSFGTHEWRGFDAALNQHIFKIQFEKEHVAKSFFRYAIDQKLDELIGAANGGVGLRHVTKGTFEKTVISFPPLAEQKVIADKLDTLLAQVETTKARLERIPNILKTFRQSVLAAAVSGELTEEWRSNNKGTQVEKTIEKIKEARQLVVSGRDKKANPHLSEEEYPIPETWQWVSLDSISRKITDGAHHTPKYTPSGINFISVKDIRGGEIDFSNTKYISREEHQELSKRCPVELGDLLITKSGTIGRTAIVQTEKEFSLFVSVALIKPASGEVNTKFIDIALRKWVNEIDVSSRIVGSAIKNLHLRDMKVLAIPFAPKEEQTQIVRRVEELFAFADTIEQKAKAGLDRVNNLTQSILAKAFRGELTADWRAANPDLINGENSAEALLEKIKAEREAIKKQPKVKPTGAKKKTGSRMSKQIIKVVDALKQAGKPLSGQQLLAEAGYPSDSSTDQLEQFFLDIRETLATEKYIVKLERKDDGQDWFALAEAATNE